jgi:hypothetical protein
VLHRPVELAAFTKHSLSVRRTINSSNDREFGQARQKERGAWYLHKRLLYCVNVNRTSLDHLLLGRNADVDKNVEWSDYSAGSGRCQNERFLRAAFLCDSVAAVLPP